MERKKKILLVDDEPNIITLLSSRLKVADYEVVIASDYFKTFAASLRKLVGGELRTYESLMERARREALLRMLESARRLGANCVLNVRFSTSNIGTARRRQAAAMVEVYAYGTALHLSNPSSS